MGLMQRRERRPQALVSETSRAQQLVRVTANVVGAAGAAYFAAITVQVFLETHRLLGAGFFLEQMIVVAVYLLRRPRRRSRDVPETGPSLSEGPSCRCCFGRTESTRLWG